MAKKAKVYTGTEWVDLAAATTDLSALQTKTATGLNLVIPTSISGSYSSASIAAGGAVQFTSATSLSVNGCFSSLYDSYKIIVTGTGTSTSDMTWKLRASGADNTGTPWGFSTANQAFGGTSWILGGTNGAVAANIGTISTTESSVAFDLHHPFNTKIKTFQSMGTRTDGYSVIQNGYMNSTASWTGFTVTMPTATGQVRIYGYNNGL